MVGGASEGLPPPFRSASRPGTDHGAYWRTPVTVAQKRVLRVVAWVGTIVGAVLLVLTCVLREYSYRLQPNLFLACV